MDGLEPEMSQPNPAKPALNLRWARVFLGAKNNSENMSPRNKKQLSLPLKERTSKQTKLRGCLVLIFFFYLLFLFLNMIF